jgi:Skp family chaperone for outer membrane proteins
MSSASPITLRVSPLAAALLLGVAGIAATAWSIAERPAALAPAPATIALVDVGRLVNGLNELKDRNDAAKARGSELEGKLKALEKTIKDIDDEIKNTIAATDSKRRLERMADKFEAENLLKARLQAYQQIIDIENGDIVRDLYSRSTAAIEAFAKKEGFDLVLLDDRGVQLPNFGSQDRLKSVIESKRILFAREGMDVTDRIVTIMNNEYTAAPKP